MLPAPGIGDIGLWVGTGRAEEARRLIREAQAQLDATPPEESEEERASEG